MDTMAWFEKYLENHPPHDRLLPEAEWAVRVCEKLYRRTGDAAFRAHIVGCADAMVQWGNVHPGCWRALFFALAETGEAKYREAIENVMRKAWRDTLQHPDDLHYLCDELPFRMAYEMRLGGMEKVGLVAAGFRQICQKLRKEDTGLYGSLSGTVRLLLALLDAIGICSDQLYEHWRAMVDLYRAGLTAALSAEKEDQETEAMLVYAIHEGVRMGLIDPERYLPIARKRIAALRAAGHETAAAMLEMEGGAW